MRGLVHVPLKKEATNLEWTIKRTPPASNLDIPFDSTRQRLVVNVGDPVVSGQMLAEPTHPEAVSVHSSAAGRIAEIVQARLASGLFSEAIRVQSDRWEEKSLPAAKEIHDWQNLGFKEGLQILQRSGVVEMFPDGGALHAGLAEAKQKKIDALILNACEQEPYVTSTYALCMSHPVEVLKGLEIIRRILEPQKTRVAFQDNIPDALELFKSKIFFLKWNHLTLQSVPALYPQGENTVLARTLLGMKKNGDWDQLEKVFVVNPATAFAVYEAVACGKPFYERAVTISGECVARPKNLWVRMGTRFQDAAKNCKGVLREPGRILSGGPMRGLAQPDWETVLAAETDAIIALPKEVVKPSKVDPCIRCGDCSEACPVDISPMMITLASERDMKDLARAYGVEECIECGNCSYVCPSNRPMLELLQYAKS